jgi:hypothetical protein
VIYSNMTQPLSLFLFFCRALALLSLYPQADPSILGWFPEVVNIAQDVLCEEERSVLDEEQDPSHNQRDIDGASQCSAVSIAYKKVSHTLSTSFLPPCPSVCLHFFRRTFGLVYSDLFS